MMRVCFLGAYDRDYPRNRILREGLARLAVEVVEARVPERRALFRYPALALALARRAGPSDVLLVPEFRHKDVPLARAMRRGRTLVFDPLVSRHDTLVGDWGLHRERSAQARWNRWLDRWSFSLPDLLLCDTWAHGELFVTLGAERTRLRRVLVGAEDGFFAIGPPPAADPVRIVYVGGFLPLHGMATVIEAAARLEREPAGLPAWRIELTGTGIEFERAKALAARAALARVHFPGAIPYRDAPRALADAHVVLGAFGAGEKAGRVIPHKVYQGLAAGRAVVTGDGAGLREVFEPGRDLIAVPRADAAALASALRDLITRPARRAELGEHGRGRALEVGTPERVARSLCDALEGVARGAA